MELKGGTLPNPDVKLGNCGAMVWPVPFPIKVPEEPRGLGEIMEVSGPSLSDVELEPLNGPAVMAVVPRTGVSAGPLKIVFSEIPGSITLPTAALSGLLLLSGTPSEVSALPVG